MKKLLLVICLLLIIPLFTTDVFARKGGSKGGDVNVRGYSRKDGTYVRPHIRSSPNQNKWDNYGPSKSDSELMSPRSRDSDRDEIPNYLDRDDDNDGKMDDDDNKQYKYDNDNE